MKPNPIMAEIRRTRDAFAHRHGNDFDKIVDAVMASQSERVEAMGAVKKAARKKPARRKAA